VYTRLINETLFTEDLDPLLYWTWLDEKDTRESVLPTHNFAMEPNFYLSQDNLFILLCLMMH